MHKKEDKEDETMENRDNNYNYNAWIRNNLT
jgi:hypothetical protein